MHRLTDGQVKHSPEVFYAGSLWKVRACFQYLNLFLLKCDFFLFDFDVKKFVLH